MTNVEKQIDLLKTNFIEGHLKTTAHIVGVAGYVGANAVLLDVLNILKRTDGLEEFCDAIMALANDIRKLGATELNHLKKGSDNAESNFVPTTLFV